MGLGNRLVMDFEDLANILDNEIEIWDQVEIKDQV